MENHTWGRTKLETNTTYGTIGITDGRIEMDNKKINAALGIGNIQATNVTDSFNKNGQYQGLKFEVDKKDFTQSVIYKKYYDLNPPNSLETIQGKDYDYFVNFYYSTSENKKMINSPETASYMKEIYGRTGKVTFMLDKISRKKWESYISKRTIILERLVTMNFLLLATIWAFF